MSDKPIRSALISVFNKEGLDPILQLLQEHGVSLYSTGGTKKYIEEKGYKVRAVEDITSYPSILGGRVKTLHPKIFGGILARRDHAEDQVHVKEYDIPLFDLVMVDLYPFEETLSQNADHHSIIEKIDIGGISLIRAAAKNYHHVLCVPSKKQYEPLQVLLAKSNSATLEERRNFAAEAFTISSQYDQLIGNYLGGGQINHLRYGENPHQKGRFVGDLDSVFTQLHGKALSYNNLLDIDATFNYLKEFDEQAFVVVKHNNACGLATGQDPVATWKRALAGDPVSAFGGIIGSNQRIGLDTAKEINDIFCEVVMAPEFTQDALALLKTKKNRIILETKNFVPLPTETRTLLNGTLMQDKDLKTETAKDLKTATQLAPDNRQIQDLLFANKIVKNAKSNTIVLAKDQQLLGLGCGMTSRVDALQHAIHKAQSFNLDLKGAVMASDAFFPFPDCVEIAHKVGIEAVIQPGGSIKDQLSIDYCNENQLRMVFTGTRHFKH